MSRSDSMQPGNLHLRQRQRAEEQWKDGEQCEHGMGWRRAEEEERERACVTVGASATGAAHLPLSALAIEWKLAAPGTVHP